MSEQLDKIHIRDLALRCIVGIYPEERQHKQDVIISIMLFADLRRPCQSDVFEETVDYKAIKKSVVAWVEASDCQLVEALAQGVADICLEHEKVRRVRVTVDKPGALRFARSVAVEIERTR